MALSEDLVRIAAAASARSHSEEAVAAILATENPRGERTYLCAYAGGDRRAWLAFDDVGGPVVSRERVREAVSIAALYEVASEAAAVPPDELRVSTLASVDELGAQSPNVAAAIRDAAASVDDLVREVESNYKLTLTDGR